MAAWVMAFVMVVTSANIPVSVNAAKKPKLNRSSAVIKVGKTVKLQVKNAGGKKVKWSSTKKKIATVNNKGNVTGKNPGKTVIQAKVGKKTLKCRITVKKNQDEEQWDDDEDDADTETEAPASAKPSAKVVTTPSPTASQAPSGSPTSVPSVTPDIRFSEKPSVSPSASPSNKPTESPSAKPTEGPTVSPSAKPTESPAVSPSDKPTESPAVSPSDKPTENPTVSPSDKPTESPEASPSDSPTMSPSPSPTKEPVFAVQIITRKDDSVWEDSGYKYYLKKQGANDYEESMEVQKGTYDIYVSDGNKVEDTGVDIAIENETSCVAYVDYYTVSFTDENNNLLANIEKQIVRKGQKAECPSNSGREGYTFEGWYCSASDGSLEKYDFTQEITGKTTLQGKWTQASQSTVYTAKIYLQNLDGTYSDTPSYLKEGIEATIDAAVNASDLSWEGFEPDADKNEPVIVKAGGNTVANFYYKRNSYTLTWDYNGGTKNWQSSAQETVKYGQTIVVPSDVTFTGYDLISWTKEDGQPIVSDEKMPAADMTVKAAWEATKYSVVFELNGGSFAQGQEPNDTYTIKDSYSYYGIPVREGYTFEGWIGDNGNTPQKYIWINAGTTGDKNYQAVWTATEYKIEYDLNGGNWGSLDPVTGYTIESDAIVLMTPQKEGYTFAGWTGSNGTEPQENVTIAQGSIGDKKYVANWETTATPEPIVPPTIAPTTTPITPTVSPTVTPTATPTVSPTVTPTITPTVSPTVTPTVTPTVSPTVAPTITPTVTPTVTPTITPTVSPTVTPTITPTVSPTVTPTVSPTVTPTITPTVSPTVTPTVSPTVEPTATPVSNSDTLTVGSYRIKLGMSLSEVNEVMGCGTVEEGTSPQGNQSYLYNPGGNYSSLVEVQIRDGKVVEMSTISQNFSYEGIVKAQESINDLTGNGFKALGTYKYTFYSKTGDQEYINVMVDLQRDSKIYGIQIFDKSLGDLDTVLYPKNCTYTTAVNTYQAKLSAYYLNAYRVYHGISETMYITNDGIAQKQSEYMASKNTLTSNDESGRSWEDRLEDEYSDGDKLPYKYEYISYGSPDAFSAVTYAIAQQGSTTRFYKAILLDHTEGTIINEDGEEEDYYYEIPTNFELYIECGFANASSSTMPTFAVFDIHGEWVDW